MFISNFMADRLERENYSNTTTTSSPSYFPSTYTTDYGTMILVVSNGTSAVYKYEYISGMSAVSTSSCKTSLSQTISNSNNIAISSILKNNQASTDMPSTFSYNGNTATLTTSTTSSTTVQMSASCTGTMIGGGFDYTIYTTYGWYTI